jgi:hypothetical protein
MGQFEPHHDKDGVQLPRKTAEPPSAVVVLDRCLGPGLIIDEGRHKYFRRPGIRRHAWLPANSDLRVGAWGYFRHHHESRLSAIQAHAGQMVDLARCDYRLAPRRSDDANTDGG